MRVEDEEVIQIVYNIINFNITNIFKTLKIYALPLKKACQN
jgi:glutamate formiminotransferase